MSIEQDISTSLKESFKPIELIIKNQSHLHKNHDEYRENSHFSVTIVSKCFEGISRINRHKMVYNSLRGLLTKNIHALQIKAMTPQEYS